MLSMKSSSFEIKEDEEDVEQELESDGGDPSLMEVDPEEE